VFNKAVDISIVLSKIKDNSVIAISGFNMAITPEYLINGLYENYLKEDHPKNIFIIILMYQITHIQTSTLYVDIQNIS
jgi:propionate CoA-transferase